MKVAKINLNKEFIKTYYLDYGINVFEVKFGRNVALLEIRKDGIHTMFTLFRKKVVNSEVAFGDILGSSLVLKDKAFIIDADFVKGLPSFSVYFDKLEKLGMKMGVTLPSDLVFTSPR